MSTVTMKQEKEDEGTVDEFIRVTFTVQRVTGKVELSVHRSAFNEPDSFFLDTPEPMSTGDFQALRELLNDPRVVELFSNQPSNRPAVPERAFW